VDQPTRKACSVWNFFLEPNDSDIDVRESCVEQRFLDRIDLVVGERNGVELRRISREETRGGFMGNPAKWVMLV